MLGGDAFGMELDAVGRRVGVAHRHHRAVLAPRIGDQRRRAVGRRRANDSGSRRTARAGRRTGRCRHGAPRRSCRASARRVDRRAARQRDRLVAEAHAEQRLPLLDAGRGQRDRNAGILAARPGPGEIRIPSRPAPAPRRRRARRCARRATSAPSDAQIVDQHEGEAVDIVDHQEARPGHRVAARAVSCRCWSAACAPPRSLPRCA